MNAIEIRARADSVWDRIAQAAERAGRSAAAVRVLPVTKAHPPAMLREVVLAGFDCLGENRVDEAEEKIEAVGRLGAKWHMVGHLQRNKAAAAVRVFDVVESVDSLRLARRLALVAERMERESLPILVQVNASGETTKQGIPVDRAVEVVHEMSALAQLDIRGLMTMAPLTDDDAILRRTFRLTRECLERCRQLIAGCEADTLSMGMSNDFEIAVEEGSTELRLGTVLLGERPG